MKRTNARNPPFAINRNDARSLLDQVADGLRAAIVGGYYGPGDEIPSSRELCPLLGVSRIVTSAALERLVEEGYVLTRHGLHPVVRDRNAKQWRGRVLFVYADYDVGFFQTILAEELCERLTEAGWLFSRIAVHARGGKGGHPDFSLLDAALASSVNLAIVLFDNPAICRHLAAKSVPYAAVSQKKPLPRGAVGVTFFDSNAAMPEFATACRAAGIRKVVQIGYAKNMCDAAPLLRDAGIAVTTDKMFLSHLRGDFAVIENAGRLAVARLIKSRALDGETLLFCTDDYLARGAITAMFAAGLKVPEDVRFATWSNCGLGPVYIRELSRMEMNPTEAGKTVTDSALEYLRSGRYPAGTAIAPKWINGETMKQLKGTKQ